MNNVRLRVGAFVPTLLFIVGCTVVSPPQPVILPPAASEPPTAGESLSGKLDGATLRLAMRDLAIVLDTLGSLERVRPELKARMLAELAAADGPGTARVIDDWRKRVVELRAAAGESATVSPASFLTHRDVDRAADPPTPAAATQPIPTTTVIEYPRDVVALPTVDELWQALAEELRVSAADSNDERTRLQAAVIELVRRGADADATRGSPDPLLWEELKESLALSLGLAGADHATRAEAAERLAAAARRLNGTPPLVVRNLTFCRRIDGYGSREPIRASAIHRGQTVLLYSEVENFATRATGDGAYESVLHSALELVDPSGAVAWRYDFGKTEDRCAAPRRDYFLSHQFQFPPDLAPGTYELRLKLRDGISGKEADGRIEVSLE